MLPLPRDPEHDIDSELRQMLTREETRYLLERVPAADDSDDPEV